MKHLIALALFVLVIGAAACSRVTRVNATPTQAMNATSTTSSTSAIPTRAAPPTAAPTNALAAPIPSQYQSLYNELDASLAAFDQSFSPTGSGHPVTFATELLPANGNRGTALLAPQTLQGVRVNLDHLQALGVQGVTVAIKYPLLTPDFPNSSQYLEFFKNVANEVRARNMKIDVEVGAIFPPPFSALNVNYKGLTLDQYEAKYRQMVTTIINEIKPDYLDLGAEPDTEAAITGIRELDTPQGYTNFINYTLKDLDRGNTKIGAGSGTWASVDFVEGEAANTSLDFIALHIYPVTGRALPNALAMADLAHQNGKRVILDEAWLYKSSGNDPVTSVAANSEIFRRDTYSFWAPLDQKFLAVMTKLAHAKDIEYISPFWSSYFFAYLDYDPKLETLAYNDLSNQENSAASRNIIASKLSSTGEYYKQLSTSQP